MGVLTALFALALAPSALAGPPTHPLLPGQSLFGAAPDPGPAHPPQPFDRACGAAVDSEGDVYVASAGNDAIDVFNPAREYLTRIANTNEPCALAVNSKGELFVSEQGTGNVVRYKPSAYPFTGIPAWDPREEIDSSGEAAGIAIDRFDDRLYVAKGSRIDVYDPNGKLGIDEVQRVRVFPFATGGTFRLSYGSTAPTTTAPIAYDAPSTGPGSVQERLEDLGEIEPGDVVVTEVEPKTHDVGFIGSLARTDVAPLIADPSGLEGEKAVGVSERTEGFGGHIGEGDLTGATGIAPYVYEPSPGDIRPDRYLAVADAATDEVKLFSGPDVRTLELRRTITGVDHDDNPASAEQEFGFGPEGAYLASDPGYCPTDAQDPQPKQACTAGHFLLYDKANEVVDEFEATGEFLLQIPSPEPPFSFEDAEPSAIAIDRSGGPKDGTSYVTAGAGPGARALAFKALAPPSRLALAGLSFDLQNACGMAIDKAGNRYAAADTSIYVYPPTGDAPLATITAPGRPCDVAVDSECNLYAVEAGGSAPGDEKAVYRKPSACPPVAGTTYGAPITVATPGSFPRGAGLRSVALNPKNDRIFVSQFEHTIELDAAANGSAILDPCFACSITGQRIDLAVHGESGRVYLSDSTATTVYVTDAEGEEILARITGRGSRKGVFAPGASIAVDQRNGHLLALDQDRGVAEEYEASGTFVAEFGSFSAAPGTPRIAVDNSGGPNEGNVYVGFFEDVSAFAPLSYAEAPIVAASPASGVGGGKATLNGTVDPRGFEVQECRFDYTTASDFLANGFAGPLTQSAPCVPGPAGIGSGNGPVAVHANLTDLDPDAGYHFRLLAENEHGTDEAGGLFGPPILNTRHARPVSYTEATLRARVNPSGLATTYRFQYGPSTEYGQTTSEVSLAPDAGPTEVEVPIFGLQAGTTYHFRVVVENEAKELPGPDQTLKTLTRTKEPPCPNSEFRTGPSASLPDCRAYELVTPADMQGLKPDDTTIGFSHWLVPPRGAGAGERLSFFTEGTLPGFEGNGLRDGYRAERGQGEGPHPAQGWSSVLTGPSYLQAAGSQPGLRGTAASQLYSLWDIRPFETLEGRLTPGSYLRTPARFEPVAQGSLGADFAGQGRYISADGSHVIFFSEERLEPGAAPAGTTAIYDRAAGAGSATVVSVKPQDLDEDGKGDPFGAGENATYLGTSEDGSAVAFEVDGALYLGRDGRSVEVASAPYTFAGLSADGSRLFYTDSGDGEAPGQLFAFEASSQTTSPIAPDSVFVHVSADGSHVYFTSTEVLDNALAGSAGADNLYLFDGGEIRFIALLDPEDVLGGSNIDLLRWADAHEPSGPSPANPFGGRALSPTRSTPGGEVFVFESHAQLTSYENEGFAQVYRYDDSDGSLFCVSCDPSGAPPSGDAVLQDFFNLGSPVSAQTLIPNVTDDGRAVFFSSPVSLLPEDANSVRDVYEWKAPGAGEAGSCDLPEGCLALISSGKGEHDSFLYSMTPDGRDVFFFTLEKLHGQDVIGSASIYDARKNGGIPDPPARDPCQGDACQGQGTTPPALSPPASTATGNRNVTASKPRRCPKAKRRVVRRGKARCVKKQRRQGRAKHRQQRREGGTAR